jgi:hypothetical protein
MWPGDLPRLCHVLIAYSGTFGLLFGAAAGIVRSAPPLLFAVASGTQWFALGSSYYGWFGFLPTSDMVNL